MRFSWLLFTLQKREIRTEMIRIQLKRFQKHNFRKQMSFWSFLQLGRKLVSNFVLIELKSQDPKFTAPLGEINIGGNYTSSKTLFIPAEKRKFSRVAIVWSEIHQTTVRYDPRSEGHDGDPRLRSAERRVWETRSFVEASAGILRGLPEAAQRASASRSSTTSTRGTWLWMRPSLGGSAEHRWDNADGFTDNSPRKLRKS